MRRRARVLVVEDEEAVRSALEAALSREGYEVRAEADGVTLGDAVREFLPDLGVLDVRLPVGPDGYEIARRLRAVSDLPLLFLTAADGEQERLAGFQAGADDYLTKPFFMAELLARAQGLLRRAGRLRSAVWQVGPLLVDESTGAVVHADHEIELRPREYELLLTLVKHRGQVLSKTQLLTAVWGYDAYDTNLVEVHVSSLRRALETHGPRVIHTVRGMGYVLRV